MTTDFESELVEHYRSGSMSPRLAREVDHRFLAALERRGSDRGRWRRRVPSLAAAAALVAMMALAGGAVAQRIIGDDEVFSRPGLTNFGQPFWGTDILDRTPAEAAAMAAAKGYAVRWQVEHRHGTDTLADDDTTFTDVAPACGSIAGGSVLEPGQIQMVVVIDDPLTPGSDC